MSINYANLYQTWAAKTTPSPTTARMTRKTLAYVAEGAGSDDWGPMPVLPADHALVLLDAAMTKTTLVPQSRSNYRCYLRRLYRFAADEGIDLDGQDPLGFWPAMPTDNGVPRRAQVAYERFVKWAIGGGIWPRNVKPKDVLAWALHERDRDNAHWRKDYERLHLAWRHLSVVDGLPGLAFADLPAKRNEKYAVPLAEWPAHLRNEWEKMCREASVPLRKGGMRAWRPVTQKDYEKRLTLYLGWFMRANPNVDLGSETWATLLSAERCRDYLNWLVERSGRGHLNPGHPAFLRMVRGWHRFLLGSDEKTIDAFTELVKRCEVEERDKVVRLVPYPELKAALTKLLDQVNAMKNPTGRSRAEAARLASLQVDTIIMGLLTTRALRSRNIRQIRIGNNLIETDAGFRLTFTSWEMKGHRKFEISIPRELEPVLRAYLAWGYHALAGRAPKDGDMLLLTRKGTPFNKGAFGARVLRISRKYVHKPVNAHLYRHILATYAAQVLRMTPTELAAFLAHRSVMTVMKYYEVTNPTLAAQRFDQLGNDASV